MHFAAELLVFTVLNAVLFATTKASFVSSSLVDKHKKNRPNHEYFLSSRNPNFSYYDHGYKILLCHHNLAKSWRQRSIRLLGNHRIATSTARPASTTASAFDAASAASSSTFLVRVCFLRAMAFIHLVAFTIALRQNKALIGDKGITPARHVLHQAHERGSIKRQRRIAWRLQMDQIQRDKQQRSSSSSFSSNGIYKPTTNLPFWKRFQQAIGRFMDNHPRLAYLREVWWDRSDRNDRPTTTLLWLAKDRNHLNPWLDGLALSGMAVAALILVRGAANVPLMMALWLIQKSFLNVGRVWYGYGWEPQLAELSFHAMFLVPLWSLNPFPSLPISPLVQYTIKWHLFRIMMGSGLIKIRSGDVKWRNLTTMDYFYETQPVPNPLTRYFHWMPQWWHKFEVLANHFVELVASWLLIIPCLPASCRRAGGMIQLVFQAFLISSGNLSFLNWLTMVPAIMCLDDGVVRCLFGKKDQLAAVIASESSTMPLTRKFVNVSFLALVAYLSIPVVRNLLSEKQTMNAAYDPLRLVNSYGAFGRVAEEREEWIISASVDGEDWKEYEFKVKPGNVYKSPRFISPYHYRLDWQVWLAATVRSPDRSPWLYALLAKLLESDPGTVQLIKNDPFQGALERPKYIKVDAFKYEFHKPQRGERPAPYWDRTFRRQIYPRQGFATMKDLLDDVPRMKTKYK